MRLDQLEIGKSAKINKVLGTGALRNHFLSMGLTPNTEVTLIKTAPMKDPIEINIRGYMLTLRKEEASKIIIGEPYKKVEEVNIKLKDDIYPLSFNKKNKVVSSESEKVTFALVGNQNCGKTTLFNQLTGSNQHVGNFPGVTVDRKDGLIRGHQNITVTDLPGIYSMSPYSDEEIVTRDFLLKERPNGIINIVDATNIERNLYLTMQLLEMNIPVVVALNMMDEVYKNGGAIMVKRLEKLLGVPIVLISASKNEGIGELIERAIEIVEYKILPIKNDFCRSDGNQVESALHRSIHAIMYLIEDHAKRAKMPIRFSATKLLEDDKLVLEKLNLDKNEKETLEHIKYQLEQESGIDKEAALADIKYEFISRVCNQTVVKTKENKSYLKSLKIDEILTGKYTAIPFFLLIIGTIFWLTFGLIGSGLSDLFAYSIKWLIDVVDLLLIRFQINPVVHSLIIDGVFTGVGSVLSFLPIIVVLFFFLSLLEDTGYMARVSFVMDKMFRKIGLSGKSFVPMLIGFGCSVPAIMATRTLSSSRDKKMTIFLIPFMSCSAKLPVYAFFTYVFFPENQTIVMMLLYLIGIFIGIIITIILNKFVFKGNSIPFVLELPNYRLPSAKTTLMLVWDKVKEFVTKAFTIIFLASIAIWFLQTFDIRMNVVADSSDSLLAAIGNLITPIFKPLGFGDWKISTALLTGFIAKESVVSTLTVLLGNQANLSTLFSTLTAFIFLVFTLLYTPCIAAIATVKKELGSKWAILIVFLQCTIAWLVSFLLYRTILLISSSGLNIQSIVILFGITLMCSYIFLKLMNKKDLNCSSCSSVNCSGCIYNKKTK
ncbi:MAG: ferrous iron transport protein B [Bacilli bacterium]|nr:ferrous iron transport protein B [Bacilli bacterium]MDD4733380.1 ferrous iron transport protein B [Bacilli bacterium]